MPEPKGDYEYNAPEEEERDLADTLRWAAGFVVRRRWWIFLPACFVVIVSSLILPHVPHKYTSESTLVVAPQQIPTTYVTPLSMMTPSEAIRDLVREILSRPRLLRIIDDSGLYPEAERSDALAERMRQKIGIEPLDAVGNQFNWFKLTFTAETPHLAQEVTSRLTSLFIEENLRSRAHQAESTEAFLSAQLEESKARLTEQEERLKSFKIQNLGHLPEHESLNLATLNALRSQLQNVRDRLSRAEQMRSSLETVLSTSLARLRTEQAELLSTLTSQHPEVVKKDVEITRMQALLDRLRTGSPIEETIQTAEDITFVQLRNHVERNITDIFLLTNDLTNEEKRLKAEIDRYQNRLKLTPVIEQQLASILRDYEQHKKDYSDLLDKQLKSQLAANLDEFQQGQRFRLVDPPSFPHAPSSPHRMKFLLVGVLAGIALGLVLGLLLEMQDRSFHSEKEIDQVYPMPLMVSIPLILTPEEARSRRQKRAFEYVAACAMILAVAVAQFYAL